VNLYGKVIVLILALFVCGGALNYVVQRQVVLPSFEALEQDLARTDVERVNRAIDTELSQLLVFCADWGNWLETYEFMAGDNPAFIAENMTPATLEAAGLDLVGYLDADGRYLWRTGRNPDTRAERAYDLVAGDALDVGARKVLFERLEARQHDLALHDVIQGAATDEQRQDQDDDLAVQVHGPDVTRRGARPCGPASHSAAITGSGGGRFRDRRPVSPRPCGAGRRRAAPRP
jgi:sensor domain CHASE-containing protein